MTLHDNHFYIAEGGQLKGGRILKIAMDGEVQILVEYLPSLGDHHTNGPVIKCDHGYFGQGMAINSGVVGNDNADYGWLYRNNNFHDVPCEDILVNVLNSKTENVITKNPGDVAVTGPFSPYNKQVKVGELIKGTLPCSGAVMRVPFTGGELKLVAWGFINPYGMAVLIMRFPKTFDPKPLKTK